jgi:hypothetical protein
VVRILLALAAMPIFVHGFFDEDRACNAAGHGIVAKVKGRSVM